MSRRAHILGGAPAPRSSKDATPATHYHRALRDELQEAAGAARTRPPRDWRGMVFAIFGMVLLGGLVLGGIALWRIADVRGLSFNDPIEVESETERAWRIADRMRRPEDTTPPPAPEPLAIDLSEERALAEAVDEAAAETE